jgi:hypothetical protein
MIRPTISILLAVGLGFSLGACHDSAASSDADAAVGVYALQTVDGQPLPAVISQQGNDIAEIIQGTVTLEANRSFEDSTILRLTISGVVSSETDATAGEWSLNGRTVQFSPNDSSGLYAMTWDGQDQLTQIFNGFTLVYRR